MAPAYRVWCQSACGLCVPRPYRTRRDRHGKYPPSSRHEGRTSVSRSGVRYILQKHAGKARSKRPSLNPAVSPPMLRHTKGMHLLHSGISLEMIRDFLGHVDTKTTQIYARANLEMKRNALEKISDASPVRAIPSWQQNKNLLEWLRSL
ncbi:MAG: tyrosine-type recombinase/integrase [Acidobacteria bacterium]|nr:tyrosine-type recombinase/integrase [Acidobacteriota bacterium]